MYGGLKDSQPNKTRVKNLHPFSCLRPSVDNGKGPHSVGGPGYSRIVYCNQPLMHRKKPLNMAKEALEDWKRFMQDMKVNSRKTLVHQGEGVFEHKSWENIQVIEREYKILNLLEFTSKRKRMSVIIQDEDGQIMMFCKGADSIIFDRLAKNGRMYEEPTTKHLNEYGEAGLRTLALAFKKLDESEYSAWNSEFVKAKASISSDRDAQLEQCYRNGQINAVEISDNLKQSDTSPCLTHGQLYLGAMGVFHSELKRKCFVLISQEPFLTAK
ncbi:hypothetical protein K2173_004076 [Erythroxylum novogranatense]|uniref:Uncharacterized protein n=1 Tax=Erythroxylum novogranatense TaxID=1862640 RepID=A0AAV8SJN9_9ROSI|nr:hypothetical protein K2173_004076 [Erythroxylum novogranatense]